MKITYIFPSRSRPEKFFAALVNIYEYSYQLNYEVIAILDSDDLTMNNDEVKDKIKMSDNVKPFYGVSTGKVNAINRELDKISDDTNIICLHSDDFVFTMNGFDNDIRKGFSDGFNGLLHFPDGRCNERLITYPIMSKEYLNRFGYIYHPDYISVYADEEQQDVAKILGQYKYVDKQIMQHQHYRAGFGEPDKLMIHNDSPEMYKHDSEVYHRRKAINFGLNKTTV